MDAASTRKQHIIHTLLCTRRTHNPLLTQVFLSSSGYRTLASRLGPGPPSSGLSLMIFLQTAAGSGLMVRPRCSPPADAAPEASGP